MHALLLNAITGHTEDKINQCIYKIIMLLAAKAN